jgi:RNA ligase (TIGR02306 family)
MSTHEVKVVKIDNIYAHGNADKLEITKIWGYECVIGKGQFKIGDLVAFIEPDYVVDVTRPEFASLARPDAPEKTKIRITVRRFRGVYSSGLLIPAPKGSKEGDNVMEQLGIERWEPPATALMAQAGVGGGSLGSSLAEKGPDFKCPVYDLENLKKFHKYLSPEDEVIATAKLHGSNARFVYSNGKMYCGSRQTWKKKPGYYFRKPKAKFHQLILWALKLFFSDNPEKIFNWVMSLPFKWMRRINPALTQHVGTNAWWIAHEQNPWIEQWCKTNPDVVLYGEVVGPEIQGAKFHYGFKSGEIGFFVFDILENGEWLPNEIFSNERFKDLKFVPTLYRGKFDLEIIAQLAEQTETFNNANHIREGVVVKKVIENSDNPNRLALKYVSNQYLEKS